MLSFRPKGGISDYANDRDVSTSLRSVTPLESLCGMTELRVLMSTYLARNLRSIALQCPYLIGNLILLHQKRVAVPGGVGNTIAGVNKGQQIDRNK